MRWTITLAALLALPLLLWGCPEGPPTTGDDDAGDDDGADDDAGDDDAGDDDAGDDDAGDDDSCADYRTQYPSGSYGTSVGSVLEDWPGMVLGDGSAVSLADVYADTSKVALVVANAFDS